MARFCGWRQCEPNSTAQAAWEGNCQRKPKLRPLGRGVITKDVIGSANWKQVCKENEQMREALNEIRFRIDNMPQDMSLTPNSAIFDLIRYLTNMALGEQE